MLAIIDPFSGIAGDMTLGALVDLGLDSEFVRALPATLGLDGIGVRIERVQRCGIGGVKVDFDIPPQPHGRHLKHILEIVEKSPAPQSVKDKAAEAFRLIASIEADVHGTTIERVHLHEVGAVDAILDIVGSVWGFEKLNITEVRCGVIALGEGFVNAAHGRMPVPAPATARLVEGLQVAIGPPESGELTTPTGAVLVRVLASGPPPRTFTPQRVGYGAGTKEFAERPNLLRITLADSVSDNRDYEQVVMLSTDIDDMTSEHVAHAADDLRADGALDVTVLTVAMKKGRVGIRLDVLARPSDASRLEHAILMKTSSIGVRRSEIFRRVLPREEQTVEVLGHTIRVKSTRLPDGSARVKPESDDVRRVTLATGQSAAHISAVAVQAAQQQGFRV